MGPTDTPSVLTRPRTPTLRSIAAVVLTALAFGGASCVPAPDGGGTTTTSAPVTVPVPSTQQARNDAAAWLLAQFDPEGFLPHELAPSVPDLGNQVLAVTNLAALDVGSATAADRLARLEVDVEEYLDQGTCDRPGALARTIMAVVAAGADPRDFGDSDLVARLESTQQPSGLFGAQPPSFDGSFRQGLALAALSLTAPLSPTVAPGVAWLKDQQCDDGSWMMYRSVTSTDCLEIPSLQVFKDSNGTALAILGIESVGASADTDPTTWLSSVRGTDGGWATSPSGPTQVSDANSTGLVIAALEALDVDVDAAAWDALLGFQLGSGAFFWKQPNRTPNRLATLDAMVALFDDTWPEALAR